MPASRNIYADADPRTDKGEVSFLQIRTAYNNANTAAPLTAISIGSLRLGNNVDSNGDTMVPVGEVHISVEAADEPTVKGHNSGASSAFVVCHMNLKGAKTWTGKTWQAASSGG